MRHNTRLRLGLLPLLLLLCATSRGQVDLPGRVTSAADGKPIEGAAVFIVGASQGVYTDARGEFSLRTTQPFPLELEVSNLGYTPQRLSLGQRPSGALHIQLQATSISIDEVSVQADYAKSLAKRAVPVVTILDGTRLLERQSVSLAQSLEQVPGVRAMSIGNGMSKPMVRGMAFNRIAVVERGIKQEGQQWGSDHGLEIDQLGVRRVAVYKGAISLRYGGDAMGGAIVLNGDIPLPEPGLHGQYRGWARSNSRLIGNGLNLSYSGEQLFTDLQLTYLNYGDYSVPADHIVYLSRIIPLYDGGTMQNTAGRELDGSLTLGGQGTWGLLSTTLSHVRQRMGFFPGSHGVPDLERIKPDGSRRNIDFPYAQVAHSKAIVNYRSKALGPVHLSADLGAQLNDRQEMARWHTHYPMQTPPSKNPNQELALRLWTYSLSLGMRHTLREDLRYELGLQAEYQRNTFGGYSFLLPNYWRATGGLYASAHWELRPGMRLEGGLRMDYARLRSQGHTDPILGQYLREYGRADEATVRSYIQRSADIRRGFVDYSWNLGLSLALPHSQQLKAYVGRAFRLPGVNELAVNGVHHGAFRHEKGDARLNSEQGYQLDLEYHYTPGGFELKVNPYLAYYSNYIYIAPTALWSRLPHAGGVYQFTQAEALMLGGELELSLQPAEGLMISGSAAYVYKENLSDGYPLPFAPPATLRGEAAYELPWFTPRTGRVSLGIAPQYTLAQRRVERNEDPTPGYTLSELWVAYKIGWRALRIDLKASCENIFNTKYYSHIAYYRKLNIPETGRSFSLALGVKF